jgi:hypothetical protein
MGVPAPRSIHAKLYINGVYNGLFSMVEQIDEQFTNYNYSDGSGNLYKEVWPIKPNGNLQSEKKFYQGLITNRIAGVNHSIIKTFAENIINSSRENLQSVLSNHLDIDQHIALAVVDRTIRNDDGPFHWYCFWGNCEPHNFYWYENPSTQKVHLIPWDLDNAFENISENFDPVTAIADNWGDTTNNCQSFAYGEWGLKQKSAACDKIVAGLALDQSKYEELKTTLITGPMAEGVVNNKIDQWAAQIRDATEEAQLLYEDAIDINEWENEIIKLKNQLDYARNN